MRAVRKSEKGERGFIFKVSLSNEGCLLLLFSPFLEKAENFQNEESQRLSP